jgi:hypothetical protein
MVADRSELNCRYLSPATIRIPTGRFAFFIDEYQSALLPRQTADLDEADGHDPVQLERPDYFTRHQEKLKTNRSTRTRLLKIKRFVTEENIDKDDPTMIGSRWTRLKVRTAEEFNKEMYRLVKRVTLDELSNRKFVLITLHVQPESSIDVMGRYYEDQFQNIVNIWRIVPHDWLVVVKEHVCAIGNRPLRFYTRLQRLPNLCFVDTDTDSHELIRRSALVATVSGTVAYEAALMGKPAVTLAPVFFSRATSCRQIGLEDLRKASGIGELIERASGGDHELGRYVRQNSYPGVIADPISDDRCMDADNIRRVSKAILSVTSQCD